MIRIHSFAKRRMNWRLIYRNGQISLQFILVFEKLLYFRIFGCFDRYAVLLMSSGTGNRTGDTKLNWNFQNRCVPVIQNKNQSGCIACRVHPQVYRPAVGGLFPSPIPKEETWEVVGKPVDFRQCGFWKVSKKHREVSKLFERFRNVSNNFRFTTVLELWSPPQKIKHFSQRVKNS